MKTEDKLKKACEALKNMKYEPDGSLLSFFQARAKQVYEPHDLNDIEVYTIEIGFLWDFIDKALGSAVGYAGLLDSFFEKEKGLKMKTKPTEWKYEDYVHTKSDFIRMVWAALEENDTIFLYQTCMELVNIAQKKKWMSQK